MIERRALLAKLLRERVDTPAYPLSYGQRALWFIHQSDPMSAAYNVAYAVRIEGTVAGPALEQAVRQLVDRHAVLRSTVQIRDGQPLQQVHTEMSIPLCVEDGAWSDEELLARIRELHAVPFGLAEGPLLRVYLLRRAASDAVLLFVAHHIAIDAWSLGILMDEFSSLYRCALDGDQASLPVPRKYADFVHWQATTLSGPRGAELSAYWLARLAGDLPRLDLPLDHARPAVRKSVGATEFLSLDGAVTGRLREVARGAHVTVYSLMLAAFHALLYRYSGQTDLLVLAPMAGRGRSEFERTVGYFVSPSVLRTPCSGDQSFRQLLQDTHDTVLGALEHQDFPFPLLVERLNPPRDARRSLIADVMFNMLSLSRVSARNSTGASASAQDLPANGFRLTPFPVPQDEGLLDLALDVIDVGETFVCALRYATDLFDRETAVQMLAHYQVLLQGIVLDLECPVAALPLLTDSEQQKILRTWNATDAPYPKDQTIHGLVDAQVRRTPDAVAVLCGDIQLTYRELQARAEVLARALRRRGVGPSVLVGLSVQRTEALVVGLLGILKAGGAYLPLDPAYPAERLGLMLEDAGVAVIVTDAETAPSLPVSSDRTLLLHGPGDGEAEESTESGRPDGARSTDPGADDLAYVIYTSGSTGRPKGVMIPHRAAVNFLTSLDSALPHATTDVVCAVTSVSFDIALLELFWPLIRGARTVVVSDPMVRRAGRQNAGDSRRQDRSLTRALRDGANILQCTPSLLRFILEDEERAQSLQRLQLLLLGGEPVTELLVRDVTTFTSARIFNMYGPTETTVWSAVREVEDAATASLIGAPLANEQLYIVDPAGQPVPVGVAGELLVGGDGLARGYLDRPNLTAERFVPDRLSGREGASLYRTGDLARYRADGTVELLGRLDRQVKLRGYRIELPEIEAALLRHDGLKQAAVIVREDTPGDARLVAYVVASGAPDPSPPALRRFLKGQLPEYMTPSVFVRLDALPLTPNGKLDTRSLPVPNLGSLGVDRPVVRLRTPLEERLAPILERALGVPRVDPDDSFVDLGGHSLLAAQVAAAIKQQLGVELNPTLVLMQSLAQLADSCGGLLPDHEGESTPLPARTSTRDEESAGTTEVMAPRAALRSRLFGAARRLLPGGSG
ncbi:MAG: amino acid adenylation domain-containing protein [Chloroflexi bacterium]|nr:amino acid adenylation domain-containing protein [Chloroflexota bacterium]